MSEDQLAPFHPEWQGRDLRLQVKRVSPVATVAALGAVVSAVVAGVAATYAGSVAVIVGALLLAIALLAAGVLAQRQRWYTELELQLGPHTLSCGGTTLARSSVRDAFATNWQVVVRTDSIFRSLTLQMVLLRDEEIAVLARLIRAWAQNPGFGEHDLLPPPLTGPELSERLKSAGATWEEDGLAMKVPIRKAADNVVGVIPVLFVLLALATGQVTGVCLALGLGIFLASVFRSLIRRRGRGMLSINAIGLALQDHWTVPWTQITSATIDASGTLKIHRRDEPALLIKEVYGVKGQQLANVITDLARPENSRHRVPDALRDLAAARAQQKQ